MASSYKPIILTDVASKLLEKLVVIQITLLLVENNSLCTKQHGFCESRLTVSKLIKCDGLKADYLNMKQFCDIVC